MGGLDEAGLVAGDVGEGVGKGVEAGLSTAGLEVVVQEEREGG